MYHLMQCCAFTSEEHIFELLLKHSVDNVLFRRVNLFALDTKMGLLDSIQIAVLVWPKSVPFLRVLAWTSADCKFTNETMNTRNFPASPLFLWVVLHAEVVVPGGPAEQVGWRWGMHHSGLGAQPSISTTGVGGGCHVGIVTDLVGLRAESVCSEDL